MKNLKTFMALERATIIKNKERLRFQTLEIRESRGITLIALVVTIVVLLILAGITITALFGDNGLINRAIIADQKAQEGAANDISAIEDLGAQLNAMVNGSTGGSEEEPPTKSRLEELMETAATDNETVYDKYGNKIRIPAGFKILAHGTRKWKSYSRIYL